jgi:zinc transport system substrate-binding protein
MRASAGRRAAAAAVFLAAAALVVAGCRSSSPGSTATPRPPAQTLDVVSTIYPVTFISERVGGTRVSVNPIVPAGVEAHDFEPRPSDLRTIQNADVVVYSHRSFEQWMSRALETIGGTRTVVEAGAPASLDDEDATALAEEDEEDAELLDEEADGDGGNAHDEDDPHLWLDPLSAVEMTRRVLEGFEAADPAGAGVYRANAAALIRDLQDLHSKFRAGLTGCGLSLMVVSHQAYGHLAERYGLEQMALAGMSAEVESSPQRVADIATAMRANGVKHVLVEPVLSDDLARTVAEETGATLLLLHPLELLTSEEVAAGDDYFAVMARNLANLRTALQCTA